MSALKIVFVSYDLIGKVVISNMDGKVIIVGDAPSAEVLAKLEAFGATIVTSADSSATTYEYQKVEEPVQNEFYCEDLKQERRGWREARKRHQCRKPKWR